MMESVLCEYLLDALNDLNTEELMMFKWHLKNSYRVGSSELEKAKDNPDTVDLMKKRFGPERAVKITVDILRKMNQNHLAEQLEKKHKQEAEPKTMNDFLKYYQRFSLDLNTVFKYFHLSEGNTVITLSGTRQPYPDHPDRFDHHPQVLCRESVCDRRCYWEIKWSGLGVLIAVSYKSIRRKGEDDECGFGYNNQSWSLICSRSSYIFIHNDIETDLSVKPISSKVGVYVDHSAGILSFYSVSGDTMILIHTVQTTFTQPLYPGFGVSPGSSLKL